MLLKDATNVHYKKEKHVSILSCMNVFSRVLGRKSKIKPRKGNISHQPCSTVCMIFAVPVYVN